MIPPDHVWLFWDVASTTIDLERDRRYVLARVLERGRLADVRWVISRYGFEGIREFFQESAHPEVSRRTRGFWRAFFRVGVGEWPER